MHGDNAGHPAIPALHASESPAAAPGCRCPRGVGCRARAWCDGRRSAGRGARRCTTTCRQGAARLQQLGRERDDGGLRAALHAAQLSQVVGAAGGQHGVRRGVVPRARGGRCDLARAVWLSQCVLGDRRNRRDHLRRRAADQRLCRAPRPRHGSADARCGLRLHRLDPHVVDLRVVHLHLLRARGGDHGVRARARVRHSAGVGLPDLRAGRHSAGHAWRHCDQQAAGLDATAVAGDAGRAVRLRASREPDRAARSRRLRRAQRAGGAVQRDAVRRRDDRRHRAHHADGRAGRLFALHARAHARATARAGGPAC